MGGEIKNIRGAAGFKIPKIPVCENKAEIIALTEWLPSDLSCLTMF